MDDRTKRPRDIVSALGRGMQPADVRQANQRAILNLVAMEPGLSNAELSRLTGLAPQTVSAVLTDLEEAKLIIRGDVLRGRRGQPATPVFLNPRGGFAIGVEIGWSQIRVVLVGLIGEVLAEYVRPHAYPDAETIFTEIGKATRTLSAKLDAGERKRLIGLGLAAPSGIGDTASLLPPPGNQASLWADVDLVASVAEATGLEVRFSSDGAAACCAEIIGHPRPLPANVVFILIDTLLATSILGDNRLLESSSGPSPSLGAMPVKTRDGETRLVNHIVSLLALDKRLAEAGLDRAAIDTPAATPVTDRWIEESAFALAQALFNTSTVVDYEEAIIESALPPSVLVQLVEATNSELRRLAGIGANPAPVRLGHRGRSFVAEGAAQLRLYRHFFSRDPQDLSS